MGKWVKGCYPKSDWILGLDEYDVEYIQCPFCDAIFYDGDNDTFDVPYNYCPNCGANMESEVQIDN